MGPSTATTYRLTLTDEASGRVVIDRQGLDGNKVEEALGVIVEAGPIIKMATGASKAWDGISEMLGGYRASRRPARVRATGRGRR